MNKIFYASVLAGLLFVGDASAAMKEKLDKPNFSRQTLSLMELINVRHSERVFNAHRPIDHQTLSEILWSAFGFNTSGKRTIPTARNEQNLRVYVLRPDGVWYYDGKAGELSKISEENAIPYTAGGQDYVLSAPVHLVYTSSDKYYGPMHAGSASQNVYLYAASKGLSTVVRGSFDRDKLNRALKLPSEEMIIADQPIGYAH